MQHLGLPDVGDTEAVSAAKPRLMPDLASRWATGPVGVGWHAGDAPSPDHRDERKDSDSTQSIDKEHGDGGEPEGGRGDGNADVYRSYDSSQASRNGANGGPNTSGFGRCHTGRLGHVFRSVRAM